MANLDRFNDDQYRYFPRHSPIEQPTCFGCDEPVEYDGYCSKCLKFEIREEEECQTHLMSM